MTRATAMTALAGVLITLAVVGGFLALDRTVLHLYYNDDAAAPSGDVAENVATPMETQPPAPTETGVPAPATATVVPSPPANTQPPPPPTNLPPPPPTNTPPLLSTNTPPPPPTPSPLLQPTEAIAVVLAWVNGEDAPYPYNDIRYNCNDSVWEGTQWRVFCSGVSAGCRAQGGAGCRVSSTFCVFEQTLIVVKC